MTTDAYRRIVAEAPSMADRLDQLSHLNPDDREAIRTLSAEIRRTIEGIAIPGGLAAAITRGLAHLGEQSAYAVRSSATAEDLPTASFAGQQDTYLKVVGRAAILQHVSRCWASLFTEQAVTYRQRNGIDHRTVRMAVVVQQMVFPDAAGILFTADPVTSNRKVATVDASFGLGEALVSGLVNPDVFTVRNGEVAAKQRAIHPLPGGGTQEVAIDPQRQERPALTDAQVVRLVQLGRQIEAHFGRSQDIEWCLVDDGFQIVQSRPITTLFPIEDSDFNRRPRRDSTSRVSGIPGAVQHGLARSRNTAPGMGPRRRCAHPGTERFRRSWSRPPVARAGGPTVASARAHPRRPRRCRSRARRAPARHCGSTGTTGRHSRR